MKLKYIFIFGWLISSCSSMHSTVIHEETLKEVELNAESIVAGQTLYVPVYSQIYHFKSKEYAVNLSATLSIRNTDLSNSIIITSVLYYDANGRLIRRYIEKPVELKSLASTSFFVTEEDRSGGTGANFIVEWAAETTVSEPVIEAVMIGTSSAQGISFISSGKVLKQRNSAD
ncbi:DUF3124 domain-containing protein [Synechococcales cyanobacterium C]|uniref:DUF3124 domain-containing protein n=1 Tax=Petrachloros mirabilis ULC683 TaxID=2781853 RepID=A0A8K1ZWC2_9CYAN|nr:DUF3124 domain-containing protein [Petrachloros mirabilis]NCJ05326.1 DUF3124 domain-containing protein [Petrachloros mirabilis ULC683]